MLVGLMVACGMMAMQQVSPRAAKVGWAAWTLAVVGLYAAEQTRGVMRPPPDPLLALAVGGAMLLLGVIHSRFLHRTRQDQERRLLEQELQARLAAQEAERARRDFISVMSHEIRTPLNGIVGLVSLMQDERVDVQARYQYLRMLEQSSHALSNLVNAMLDFGNIDSDRIELQHEPFSIRRWARDLESSFSAAAAVKGLYLQVELDASVGDEAMGDEGKLRQIAANYISNAIKFTKAGTIRMRIRRPRGDDLLRLEVRDSGIGLTHTAQQEVFKPPQQQGGPIRSEFGGGGMGLSICDRLARLMGGAVGVNSLTGVGSTFWAEVQVPTLVREPPQPATNAAPEAASQPAPQVEADAQPFAAGKQSYASTCADARPDQRGQLANLDLDAARVLVVDDNALNRTTTSQMLRRMNAIVATANDGQEGLDAIRAAHDEGWPFDLVLMDVQMPGMDGLTAVGLLRADPSVQDTPVVALTAGVHKDDVTRAIEAGMDGFLAKPVTAERLGRNVAHFAALGRQRRGARQDLKF